MALFGQTAVAIRIVLLLVNLATIFLIALLGKRLFGIDAGLLTRELPMRCSPAARVSWAQLRMRHISSSCLQSAERFCF